MPDWPHAPIHRLTEAGAYMVTAGTYRKAPYFRDPGCRGFLHEQLLILAAHYGWRLQAWAVFANHYHFVAIAAEPKSLRAFIRHLHSITAREVNRVDGTPGRKVWHEYWETHLTYERSYLARLCYVHQNAVRHGAAQVACAYPWCSAAWFEREAPPAFYATVMNFRTDRVTVPDGFDEE